MPHPLNDLVAQPIERMIQLVEGVLNEENKGIIWGEEMLSPQGAAPPRPLIRLAFINDCLRIIEIALDAMGSITDRELIQVFPLVKVLAGCFASIRPDYRPFATLELHNALDFLAFHFQDAKLFGNACTRTQWLGLQMCYQTVGWSQDPEALVQYDRMAEGLITALEKVGENTPDKQTQLAGVRQLIADKKASHPHFLRKAPVSSEPPISEDIPPADTLGAREQLAPAPGLEGSLPEDSQFFLSGTGDRFTLSHQALRIDYLPDPEGPASVQFVIDPSRPPQAVAISAEKFERLKALVLEEFMKFLESEGTYRLPVIDWKKSLVWQVEVKTLDSSLEQRAAELDLPVLAETSLDSAIEAALAAPATPAAAADLLTDQEAEEVLVLPEETILEPTRAEENGQASLELASTPEDPDELAVEEFAAPARPSTKGASIIEDLARQPPGVEGDSDSGVVELGVVELEAEYESAPESVAANEAEDEATLQANRQAALDHGQKGEAALAQGHIEAAIQDFEAAIRLDPARSNPALTNWYVLRARAYRVMGNEEQSYALVCHLLAEKHAAAGEFNLAVACYREAIDADPNFAWAAGNLAWMLATWPDRNLRDGSSAIRFGRMACELSGFRCGKFLATLAAAQAQGGRFDDAIRSAQQAVKFTLPDQRGDLPIQLEAYKAGRPWSQPGAGAEETASRFSVPSEELDQVVPLLQCGLYNQAVQVGQDLLEEAEETLPSDHPEVAQALVELALAHVELGQAAEAKPLLMRALILREKALGKDHPEVARCLHLLGRVFQALMVEKEAEALFKQAFQIRQNVLGPDHPEAAETLSLLGLLYAEQGKFADAETLLIRALTICRRTAGLDHAELAQPLEFLGAAAALQNKGGEAEFFFKQALLLRESALGPDHPEVAACLIRLGRLYLSQRNTTEAVAIFKRALDIREKTLGRDTSLVAEALEAIGQTYWSLARKSRALTWYERSLAVRQKALGQVHPRVADSLNLLGQAYFYLGKPNEAASMYKQALGICRKTVGMDHPGVDDILCNLADVYRRHGRKTEAATLLRKALPIRTRLHGQEHRTVQAIQAVLKELEARTSANGNTPAPASVVENPQPA